MIFIIVHIVGNYDFLCIVLRPGPVDIKVRFFRLLSLYPMAAEPPTRLDEYCRVTGITFFDCQLPCLFCKFNLTLQDLANFYTKELCLVWRNNQCFASCAKCLRLCAKFENENYVRCTVKACNLESLLRVPLSNILVRCLYCFKKLDFAEKLDCCNADLPFYLVRHHWRNCCRLCRTES